MPFAAPQASQSLASTRDLQMDEAVGERRRHAVDDAAIVLAIAAGDDRGAFGQLVFAALALQAELVERGLDHGHAGGQLLQVEEPQCGAGRGRQEYRRRPAGAAVFVAPGDAPQIDRIEQQRADVDVVIAVVAGDLPGDHRFRRAGRPPDQRGLAGLDQGGEHLGELARAQRVVGGDGVGKRHGHAPEWQGGGADGSLRAPGLHPARAPFSSICRAARRRRSRLDSVNSHPDGPVGRARKIGGALRGPSDGTEMPVSSGSGRPDGESVWPMRSSSST